MKNFIKYFISRRITTLMIFTGVAVFGIISLVRVPAALMPSTEKKGLVITVRYPGQSPWRIERVITRPIEGAISSVGGIDSILSSSKEGEARIHVTFEDEIDMKYKNIELREKVDPIRAYFPRDVEEPAIYGYSSDDKPVMIITLKSESMPINNLREIADKRLKKLFERVEGISEIIIGGGVKREIEVAVKRDRLVSHKIGFQQITQLLQKNNFSVPGGKIGREREYSIVIDGKYKSISEIRATPLFSTKLGSVITLGDIAVVRDYAGRKEDIARINGIENVSLYLMKTGTANGIAVSEKIRAIADSIEHKNYELAIAYDQAEFIEDAIANLGISCFLGIILAAGVLYLFFRSFWETVPVILAIPFSLIPVFIYFYFRGMSLNVISLSGLAIAAGMTVDNGIVVLENINTWRSRTQEHTKQLYISATAEMALAIFASTLTTVSIFIPLIILGGKTRSMYNDMAGAVIIALVSSFLVAVTLIPVVSMMVHSREEKTGGLKKGQGGGRVPAIPGIGKLIKTAGRVKAAGTAIVRGLPEFNSVLKTANESRRFLLGAMAVSFIIILFLSSMLRKEYLDPLGRNELYVSVDLKSGTSLPETSRVVSLIENELKKDEAVKEVSAKIERWHSDLIVKLHDDVDKEDAVKNLKGRTAAIKDASIFYQEERSTESSRELNIEISGPEIEKIRKVANSLAGRIVRFAGVDDVVLRFKEGRPEYSIIVDNTKARETGLSSGEIGNFVRSSIFGPVASKFIDRGEVDIRVRMLADEGVMINNLPYMRVISSSGSAVPLGELANFKTTTGITTIWRKNRTRMETITVKPGKVDLERLTGMINETVLQMKIDPEYHVDYGESYKRLKGSNREMLVGIALALLLVYMAIAAVFESVKIPFIVIIAVPLALMGSLFFLMLFGRTLNISVYMGMIILTGIAVNNAIVLIDTIQRKNQKAEKAGFSFSDIIEASKVRIRPIMMTTLTTALGLAPLLFGGQGSSLWQGFAITVITGLLFSTVTVIVIVPVVYGMMNGRGEEASSPQPPGGGLKSSPVPEF